MNSRIKQVRLSQIPKMSQDAFGERLGITGAAVSRLESGDRNVTEQVLLSICREFGVSEHWLRTGEGSMLVELSDQKKIAAFLGDLMRDEEDGSFKRRLIEALSEMNSDEWELLEKLARKLTGG